MTKIIKCRTIGGTAICMGILNLYSTSTRKHSHWAVALGNIPNTQRDGPSSWYLKTLKFALSPTQTPNANRWNIVYADPLAFGPRVGHVHFMLFVSISFALGTQHKPVFEWNMGFRIPCNNNTGSINNTSSLP